MNIQFHLTNACNLRCRHCYQGEYDREIISLSDFLLILEKTKKFFDLIGDPIYSLALTGGEPLTVPAFDKYFLIANLHCKKLTLMTNGLLLTPERLENLKKATNFFKVQVSLEGPEKINDAIRGIGTYKKIRTAIKYVNEAHIRSAVSFTIAPYNYDKLVELYDDLLRYDPPNFIWFDRCIPFKGTGTITKEQFQYFLTSVQELFKRQTAENLPVKIVANRALQWLIGKEAGKPYTCGAGFRHFTIMHNGDVMICRRLNFPIGNLLEEDWSQIIKKAVPILKEIHRLPDECQTCEYATACNGGLKCLTYALYKDFNKKDINCFL